MTQSHSTNWTKSTGDASNCRIATTIGGDYEFIFNTSSKRLSIVYPYNPKQAKLYETAVSSQNPDVMLQAFYWAHEGNTPTPYTEYGDVTWGKLAEEAPELAAYFDLVWLAPSQETADFTGYLPMNYSNQGSYVDELGHHGHSPWGTGAELQQLISRLPQGGAKVVADIVLNHTSAGHVDEYDGEDKNWCNWTVNDFGRYGSFKPDWSWITAEDEMFAEDYMAGRIDRSVAAACSDEPVDGTANEQRQVKLQGNEHAEGKGEGRHAEGIQHERNDGTDAVEQPGRSVTTHQRFNHSSHRVRLGC